MELNDTQRVRLEAIANDTETISALRSLFEGVNPRNPSLDSGISNEQIGAHFRAHEEAKRLVDMAFSKLVLFKKIADKPLPPNPAR